MKVFMIGGTAGRKYSILKGPLMVEMTCTAANIHKHDRGERSGRDLCEDRTSDNNETDLNISLFFDVQSNPKIIVLDALLCL